MAIVGIVGHGVVGSTLSKWFFENTDHDVRIYDPPKGHLDFLDGCEAIFISVPVPDNEAGQDQSILKECVITAKRYAKNVFVRSTVLPSTNDNLGTISMPEFLTARSAFEDMSKYPILCGNKADINLITKLFPKKEIIMMSNTECELAKLAHNCFGAMKVTYMNIIYHVAQQLGADYEMIKQGYSITGFIEPQHTNIAQDGQYGYGGTCFPTNIKAMIGFLGQEEKTFFSLIDKLNAKYRYGAEF